MQIAARSSPQELIRAIARALLRVRVRLFAAFAALLVIAILLPNRNLLGWILMIGALATFAIFPVYVLARTRFGRLLRRDDPQLAVQLGLGEKVDWNGARNLASVEALNAFFKRSGQREFPRKDLRLAAELYLWTTRIGIALASATVGSLPAAIVVVVVLGQHAP